MLKSSIIYSVHCVNRLCWIAKLQDLGYIISLSAADLQRLTRLSAIDVAALHAAVAEAIPHHPAVTGLDYIGFVLSVKQFSP